MSVDFNADASADAIVDHCCAQPDVLDAASRVTIADGGAPMGAEALAIPIWLKPFAALLLAHAVPLILASAKLAIHEVLVSDLADRTGIDMLSLEPAIFAALDALAKRLTG